MLTRKQTETILGKTFADKLDEGILSSGKIFYSRRNMVEELGCANFSAAMRLGMVLNKLSIGTVAQLHKTDPVSLARVKGVGMTALFVAMCILDANGYSVEKWWGWDREASNVVKFSTFKHRATQRAKRRIHEVA